MAKRMQDKESIAGVSWLIVLALSCWGGLVRYLIDVKQNKATWSWINALAQIAVITLALPMSSCAGIKLAVKS